MMHALIVLLVALGPVQAYNQANRLYAQKDYAGAATAYEQALGSGPNAAVEYNLGNACFKAGKIGRAILNYRRAHYLAPRDPDIAANLDFARTYRVDKLPSASSPFTRAMDVGLHALSHREAAWLGALGCLLATLLLAAWIVRRWAVCAIAALVVAPCAVFAIVTQQVWQGEIADHPAVVVVPEVEALSGPSEESKQILLLHDGTEVRVREARAAYVLVQLSGGSGGWVREDAIERIY